MRGERSCPSVERGSSTIDVVHQCEPRLVLTFVFETVHLDVDAKSADSWYKAK